MGDFDGWYEVVLLIVLGLITFYRKELSCNADMRDELEEEKRKFSEEKEAARKKAEKQRKARRFTASLAKTHFLLQPEISAV